VATAINQPFILTDRSKQAEQLESEIATPPPPDPPSLLRRFAEFVNRHETECCYAAVRSRSAGRTVGSLVRSWRRRLDKVATPAQQYDYDSGFAWHSVAGSNKACR